MAACGVVWPPWLLELLLLLVFAVPLLLALVLLAVPLALEPALLPALPVLPLLEVSARPTEAAKAMATIAQARVCRKKRGNIVALQTVCPIISLI
jgi:hypothetical protein